MANFEGNFTPEDKGIVLDIVKEHVALLLLIDTSGSMRNAMDDVNAGINKLIDDIKANESSKNVVDIAVVNFESEVHVAQEFAPASQIEHVDFKAEGGTDMGGAINTAIDMISARVKTYGAVGTQVKKPWIFMLTDGKPGDDKFDEAKAKLKENLAANDGKGKFIFWGIGTGDADYELLKEISTPGCCGKLGEKDISELFDWMTKSLVTISSTTVATGQAAIPVPTMLIPL